MYAKALIPAEEITVPLIIATAGVGSPLVGQLHDRSWTPYGGGAPEDTGAEVQITAERLCVIIDGEVLLDDNRGNPVSPDGWWNAVSAMGDKVIVVVVEKGEIDLNSAAVGQQLRELLDQRTAAHALVKVTHGQEERRVI
ncbi:hypothetical protein [Arthrobacter rhombi]|uniref:hypothetical protein n=1 Tax=Arthrobacter rhombi TaxID=71253 RepID=UPI003FCFCBB1